MHSAEIDSRLEIIVTPPGPKKSIVSPRGRDLYFVASLISQASALLRYVALARLLGPEQLGLASTIVVTAAFFDMISDTGSDRFLIQDRHGDTSKVQNLVQLVYVGRGCMVAAALALFAIPIAAFYNAPQLAVGFVFLAFSPLIGGFLHLDLRRAQRVLDFRPEAMCMIAAEMVGLAATLLGAWSTRNFTAILYGLIARSVTMVLVSHLLAKRKYALRWDKTHAPALARFATPLMVSGLMLFIGSQGDRVLVARQLGIEALGHYSAVLLLIYYPSAIILRYMHAIYMPLVAAGRDDRDARNQVSDILGGQTLLLGMAMAIGFAIVAPPVVTILYGARFSMAALIVGLIGVLQSTRFLINWPTTVALSMGKSRTVLASNLARLFVFPGAYAGLRLIGGLTGVVAGFVAGEIISIATALFLLNRGSQNHLLQGFDRFFLFVGSAILIVAWNLVMQARSLTLEAIVIFASAGLMLLLLIRERGTIARSTATARRLAINLLSRCGRA